MHSIGTSSWKPVTQVIYFGNVAAFRLTQQSTQKLHHPPNNDPEGFAMLRPVLVLKGLFSPLHFFRTVLKECPGGGCHLPKGADTNWSSMIQLSHEDQWPGGGGSSDFLKTPPGRLVQFLTSWLTLLVLPSGSFTCTATCHLQYSVPKTRRVCPRMRQCAAPGAVASWTSPSRAPSVDICEISMIKELSRHSHLAARTKRGVWCVVGGVLMVCHHWVWRRSREWTLSCALPDAGAGTLKCRTAYALFLIHTSK